MASLIKNKAIFFDRDGVINNEENDYYIFRKKDFFLNPGIVEAMTDLRDKGYIFFIISNQGGIAKSLYKKEDVENVHAHLREELARSGIEIAEIYYCPHHPLFEKCLCRKPGTLLIEKAIARFKVDAAESWFIGDRDSDIEAGKKAGLKVHKVKANQDMAFLGTLI